MSGYFGTISRKLSKTMCSPLNDIGTNWVHTENPDFIFDESPIVFGEHNLGTPGLVNPPREDAGP